MNIITDLKSITKTALRREHENYRFSNFLKEMDDEEVDKKVFQLDKEISPQIDCTQCGNCCRSLLISVEKSDRVRLSQHLGIDEQMFTEKYLEKSSESDEAIFNAIPCHFLNGNMCSVYEARPKACAEFPHLDKPGFVFRLFNVIDNYSRCPIVFNVVEKLKKETGFAV